MSTVSPIVTRGFASEDSLIITRGFGLATILAVILEGGAVAARTILKTTTTIIRFDITHYDPGFMKFHVGKFVLKPIELTIKVTHIPKKIIEIIVHRLNFKFASKLSRIITGSKDIRIKTDDKNIS